MNDERSASGIGASRIGEEAPCVRGAVGVMLADIERLAVLMKFLDKTLCWRHRVKSRSGVDKPCPLGAYSARLGHLFRQRSGHRFRTTWALGAKRRASPAWVWDPRVAIGVVGQVIRT